MNRNKEELPFVYIYCWGNSPFRATLKGRKCRVIKRGDDMVVLEFDDGQQVVSSSWAIKRAKEESE